MWFIPGAPAELNSPATPAWTFIDAHILISVSIVSACHVGYWTHTEKRMKHRVRFTQR